MTRHRCERYRMVLAREARVAARERRYNVKGFAEELYGLLVAGPADIPPTKQNGI